MKPWKLQTIKGFILKYGIPPLWPTYIKERRKTFVKTYGIKVRAIGNFLGNRSKLRNSLV
jgi:hypothetical protein